MRRLVILFVLHLIVNQLNAEVRVKFDSAWVNYDFTQEGRKGMLTHLRFTIFEMKDKECTIAIYFRDSEDSALRDKNQKFYTTSGEVAVFRKLKPGFDESYYKDLEVFMPYDELDLEGGSYSLSMDVDVNHLDGTMIEHLTRIDFTFRQPATNLAPSDPVNPIPDAKLDKVWVDYDITEGGKSGMRIHIKFSTTNMKDVSGFIAAYFSKTDGTKITNDNKNFSSNSGQLAIYRSIKPQYPDAVYDDLQLFLPYSEIKLPAGKYNLKFALSVIYEDGTLIKTLKDHYFDFQH